MKTSDEKKYIYAMMQIITEERRELTKIYYELKSRLDEIDTLERSGLEDLSILGYVDLHNSKNVKTISDNLHREVKHIIQKLEQPPKSEGKISQRAISEAKDNEALRRKNKGLPLEKAAGIIADVLKEHGIPMAAKDLYEEVSKRVEQAGGYIRRANFRNNILPRARNLNKNIENVSRGFYQYRNNS